MPSPRRRRPTRRRAGAVRASALATLTAVAGVLAASAAFASAGATPDDELEFLPVDEYVAPDGLSGDALYERVLANRFDAFEQVDRLRSGGENGRFQDVRLRLRYKTYRAGDDEPDSPILSKTIARYFEPTDVRHLGYLVINKASGPDDQFVYRPSARKVRRVNVRGESIAGTDFSFEDVVPPEFEDGRHYRMPDGVVAGRPVYVVTVVPHAETESEYAKLEIAVEQEHFVPVRTLYWDNQRVLVKRLEAELDSIEARRARERGRPKEVWIALRSRMTHLRLDSFTELEIERLDADPELRDRHFSERELTASR